MTAVRPAIDRRSFLKLGAAASGLAIGCGGAGPQPEAPAEPAAMRYRPLGGTGLEVSEVSFGAHGVDNPPLMAAALEAGINTFATSGKLPRRARGGGAGPRPARGCAPTGTAWS